MTVRRAHLFVILAVIGAPRLAPADDAPAADTAAGITFFESKIRPVLVEHCYKCHSVDAGKSKGNLLLDSREKIRAGGDRGPAVVPGDPDASLLLAAVSHSDPDLEMPPNKERLAESVIADIKTWIRMGAPDPREEKATDVARPPVDVEAGRRFWAFRKPVAHEPPATKDPAWARRDLDRFILAKLDAAGLAPSADAEPATLLRRLHFDLVGLPPSPEAVERFLERVEAVGLDAALEPEVDALLASAALRRALGEALARRGTLRRIERQGSEHLIPVCVALPRLRHRRDERRHAVRSLPGGAGRGGFAAL